MNERRSLQLLAEKYEQVLEDRLSFSDDIRNEILSIYKNGIVNDIPDDTNPAKLAQRFKLSTKVVYRILKQSGLGPGSGFSQIGKDVVSGARKIPSDQIKYIDNLISKKDDQGVFEYSAGVITKMVNDLINAHPELNWYKMRSNSSVEDCITRWEKENIPGETRMNFGVRTSNRKILRRGLGQRIRPKRVFNPKNNSYQTATGRAQDIDDQAYQVKGSLTDPPPV